MVRGDESSTPLIVVLADSPDARLFIELASYGSDLAEARHALDLAIHGQDAGSTTADAAPYLVGFAVVAYCRTVLYSNVRPRLTDHIDVPAELIEVHDQVRTFRNATIAHSQSELSVTYPLGVLDPATLEVAEISAVTVNSSLPMLVLQKFRTLIAAIEERLDVVIEPVRARLASELGQSDLEKMLASSRPLVLEKFAEDFNPRTKRAPYPTGHTLYCNREADHIELLSLDQQ